VASPRPHLTEQEIAVERIADEGLMVLGSTARELLDALSAERAANRRLRSLAIGAAASLVRCDDLDALGDLAECGPDRPSRARVQRVYDATADDLRRRGAVLADAVREIEAGLHRRENTHV
jgi:hypothetical protein